MGLQSTCPALVDYSFIVNSKSSRNCLLVQETSQLGQDFSEVLRPPQTLLGNGRNGIENPPGSLGTSRFGEVNAWSMVLF